MKNRFYYIIALVVVISSWLLSLFVLPHLIESPEVRGQFGDSFGAVNALFSGLALAGIILTLLMQRQELSLQREELKFTREELKKSATAQDASQKALNTQVGLMSRQALLKAYQSDWASRFQAHKSMNEMFERPENREKMNELRKKIDQLILDFEEEYQFISDD